MRSHILIWEIQSRDRCSVLEQIPTSISPRADRHEQIATSRSTRADRYEQIATSRSTRADRYEQIATSRSPERSWCPFQTCINTVVSFSFPHSLNMLRIFLYSVLAYFCLTSSRHYASQTNLINIQCFKRKSIIRFESRDKRESDVRIFTRLRVYPSVRSSVKWFVRSFVLMSVCPSVRPLLSTF